MSWETTKIENDERNCKAKVTFAAVDDLPEITQIIELFEIVYVKISRKAKSSKLVAELVRPPLPV